MLSPVAAMVCSPIWSTTRKRLPALHRASALSWKSSSGGIWTVSAPIGQPYRTASTRQGARLSKEALDAYVRPAVGFVEAIRLASGHFVGVGRPINTRECDEPEMIAFFQSVEELLAKEFGYVSEQKARAA
jgi:hypothetical protein